MTLIFISTAVHADAVSECNDGSNIARQIHGCTEIIDHTMITENLSIAYINRGIAYAGQSQSAKALADFSASIAADRNNGIAYYDRGNIYFDLQNFEKAVADYSKAIELEPDMTTAYLNRAMVNEILGVRVASISDYRKALALDPLLSPASSGLKRLGAAP
ncbi:tetratricopeptide repeat protein [Hyphomicrobium sp. B1]|uniref:tetratricopeptide repeat protein n=1 Tax=unclassified Hyphomicrobium TaxID=2619925 RepID=UPI0039C369C7